MKQNACHLVVETFIAVIRAMPLSSPVLSFQQLLRLGYLEKGRWKPSNR